MGSMGSRCMHRMHRMGSATPRATFALQAGLLGEGMVTSLAAARLASSEEQQVRRLGCQTWVGGGWAGSCMHCRLSE